MSIKIAEKKAEAEEREGFFSIELFAKIKKYLHTAKKDDPPVIGTTENFCEPDPPREKKKLGMVVSQPVKKSLSMKDALAETSSGHADLVNKLIEEEADE